ncbi:integral membrane protein [Histoplasma capsulatum var. duboisii H88]|uniref:Integral membrane protein n=1 Tax=Ajellomyces capsulatus (strain H88) TaxID=544711 RepID=F0UD13_AJEC8|nr:integral membrane protein [Histoplasma capsulatum var. duboisii H88]
METSNLAMQNGLSEESEDKAKDALILSITFTSLAVFFVSARLYTRGFLVKKIGSDDWTCLVSLILSLGFMRLFIGVRRFWDDMVEGSCLNRDAFWLSTAIVHIVTDVVLLAMPMPILIRLNIPKRKRIALVLVFALGGLYIPLESVSNNPHQIMFLAQKVNSVLVISVCITSGLRLESLRQLARSDDLVEHNAAAASWSAVECNVAIICCSLPTLRPLVTRIFPLIFPKTGYGYGRNSKRKIPCLPRWFASHESQERIDQEYAMEFLQKLSSDEGGKHSHRDMGGVAGTESISQETISASDIEADRPAEPFVRSPSPHFSGQSPHKMRVQARRSIKCRVLCQQGSSKLMQRMEGSAVVAHKAKLKRSMLAVNIPTS